MVKIPKIKLDQSINDRLKEKHGKDNAKIISKCMEECMKAGKEGEVLPVTFDGSGTGVKNESPIVVFERAVIPEAVVQSRKCAGDGKVSHEDLPAYIYAPERVKAYQTPYNGYGDKSQ